MNGRPPHRIDRVCALFRHRHATNHVINADAAQRHGDSSFGLGQHRPNHVIDEGRTRRQRIIGVLGRNGGAQDVIGRDAAALPAEFVTAMRPTDTFKDASRTSACRTGSRSRGGLMTGCQGLRRHRACPRVNGDVNDRSDGEQALARHQRHWARPTVAPDTSGIRLQQPWGTSSCKRWRLLIQLPVDPKPPLPRLVLSRDATSTMSARTTGAITIWATRIPRVIVTAALLRFASRTWISPR